jgi:Flp pilus assembly protein TadB
MKANHGLHLSLTAWFALLTGAGLCLAACLAIGWGAIVPLTYFGLAAGLTRLASKRRAPRRLVTVETRAFC